MTGAGATGGGFSPCGMGMVTRLDLSERVPQAEGLIELVLQGLSPEKAMNRALEQDFPEFVGGPIADNVVELWLGTDPGQMNLDWLYTEIQKQAPALGIQFQPVEGENRVYVRSEEMGALQKLIQELRATDHKVLAFEVRR